MVATAGGAPLSLIRPGVMGRLQKRGPVMKLNVRAFALTCGLIWGLGLFCCTWWVMLFEGATGERTVIGLMYRGYDISPIGALIGLAWAFPDGLIGGLIFAWLYNLLSGRPAAAA